jgi:pyroglutamyl-peptidase
MATMVLITGFGPFPGAPMNPTGPLVQKLAQRRRPAFADTRRIAHVFPTSYAAVERELPALVARHRPGAILMFGLAMRTKHLRIEIQARNVISSVFADADRCKPTSRVLTKGASSLKRTRAPIARLFAAAKAACVPARLSRDAGRYLCNALFWRAIEISAERNGPRVVAFVHVPRLGQRFSSRALARAGEAILLAVLAAGRRVR